MALVVPTFNSAIDRADKLHDMTIARNIYKSVTANVVANRQVEILSRTVDQFKKDGALEISADDRSFGMGIRDKPTPARDITERSAFTGEVVDWGGGNNEAEVQTRYLNVAFRDAGVESTGSDGDLPIQNSAVYVDRFGSVGVLYSGYNYIVCTLGDEIVVTKR